MRQLNFAMEKPAIAMSEQQSVVLFDARRRSSRNRSASAAPLHLSGGVVVHLPLANGRSRSISFGEESITKVRAKSSDGNEMRFTSFDFVATALLILSVFAAPALVWALLRSASFG